MEVLKKFVVYKLNRVIGSEAHLALKKVVFKGWKSNNFDTEEEDVKALVDDEKSYQDYVILKQIYIN